MEEAYFNSEAVLKFQVLLEEVTRAKPGAPGTRFVPPDDQSLDRLQARFHHVLYGRRGTGKSSLLRKVETQLKQDRHLVAWADQETFSGLSYPDVLVSTLEEVFRQFALQIDHVEVPGSFFERRRVKRAHAALSDLLRQAVVQLVELKAAPSETQIAWKATFTESSSSARDIVAGGGVGGKRGQLKAEYKRNKSNAKTRGTEVQHTFSAQKREHLERAVSTYRDLILAVGKIFPDSYIILDDFYRLNEGDQPQIAGYFHRVVKDTNVWLKFGSIPYWTRLYAGGSPAVGLQVPHDLREVSLDRGLPDFNASKRFLEKILGELAGEVGVDVSMLLSDGAKDRLVLAAGAVPRDYIGLVGDSISVARNRGPSAKSGTDRIIAEDVNEAAGRTANQKLGDMDEDAGNHAEQLRELVIDLTAHCRSTGSACFLIDVTNKELVDQVGRLQNMRFVHLIDSNESLPDQQSSRYVVYLLDVSQLAAQRAWKVDFMGWTKREKRRARKLIYPVSAQPPAPKRTNPRAAAPQLTLFEDADAIVDEVDAPNSTDPVGP